jgi:hypothetical protein
LLRRETARNSERTTDFLHKPYVNLYYIVLYININRFGGYGFALESVDVGRRFLQRPAPVAQGVVVVVIPTIWCLSSRNVESDVRRRDLAIVVSVVRPSIGRDGHGIAMKSKTRLVRFAKMKASPPPTDSTRACLLGIPTKSARSYARKAQVGHSWDN